MVLTVNLTAKVFSAFCFAVFPQARFRVARMAANYGYQFMIYYDNRDMWRFRVMPSSYTIGGHFENFIKEQVEGGSYASASEVIRDGLRLLEEEQRRRQAAIDGLRGEIAKGRRSGKRRPAAEILDRLERKYTKMVKDRAK
jgi:antitoxin ParD1/3/4